ncbi:MULTISPECIES: F0F1 ATP synthase subunit B [unclassified Acidisoma]|jgi:F-type H+-transporting ATPase subunit b|uniref:F0F1 ATP synthase subunit B family protein n=1 Tax=unclassified Acidisoma TaxID=2634065 RepID=UPI00131AACBB|nr:MULTISPECIES: F0F1 ATP synthase subunit B [unclassified Acidisoma]
MRRFVTSAGSVLTGLVLAAVCLPGSAWAQEEGSKTMPQMDFKNPLTASQVVWLVIIIVALYFILSRWALPAVGEVLADRAKRIETDLEAARAAKAEADAAVAELNSAMKAAREGAHAEIAEAVARAKAEAVKEAAAASAKLDARVEQAEAQIAAARTSAMSAIRPVATDTAKLLLARLTGGSADEAMLGRGIDGALAARGLAEAGKA